MIILASSSPRRKEILSSITSDFTIVKPDVDESILKLDPKDLALEESKLKAYKVFSMYPNDTILACDTIVVLENEVLGKPYNKENAIKMLRKESGKKQLVLSGYTFINKNIEINRTVASEVYFNKLSDEEIEKYVNEMKPFDKAGAYGIQDGYGLINHIEGSYANVMGLPIEDIIKHCPIKTTKTSLEIEAKFMLSEEEYNKLLKVFLNKPYTQTNYYFDSETFDLRNNGCSIRIRKKENYIELTTKVNKRIGRQESNIEITPNEFDSLIENPNSIHMYIDHNIPRNLCKCPLKLLGHLTTERIDMAYKNGLLSLDKNSCNNTIDYEIEFEYSSKEDATILLLQFLKENNVEGTISTLTKTQRALKNC